ncbi:MAG: hypothetical protein GX325_06175 [Peptococcaceae bacterium]|nr:hypothetical protein [Peptococcaceae bacterium]
MIKYIKDLVCRDGEKGVGKDGTVPGSQVRGIVQGRHKEKGIPTYFVELISNRELLVKYLETIKIEVVVLEKALNNTGHKTTMGGSK